MTVDHNDSSDGRQGEGPQLTAAGDGAQRSPDLRGGLGLHRLLEMTAAPDLPALFREVDVAARRVIGDHLTRGGLAPATLHALEGSLRRQRADALELAARLAASGAHPDLPPEVDELVAFFDAALDLTRRQIARVV